MLSTAIIVFREILEISLIIGVLLAATRGLSSRGRLVLGGLLVGILGSGIVAFFANAISNAAEGMGQELFNAIVLLTAAVLIGWTVIWMRRYGRTLKKHFEEVGGAVISGEKPLYTLSVVIALSVLREGSEIVLFTYGVMASGANVFAIAMGAIAGLVSGTAVGVALYYGLLRISPRALFSVTGWMLILLASGMVSQALGLLQMGDFIPVLLPTVWDSSRILSEQSFLGGVLHVLIGYSARPSIIQIIGYVFTFGVIAVILKYYGNPSVITKKTSFNSAVMAMIFFFCLLGITPNAHATKKVYSPIVEGGELEIETRGSYDFDHRSSKNGKQKQKYAVGYGVTDRWFTELYGEIEKGATASEFEFTALEWENRYQLTEQGQYWVDVGLYFEYEVSFEDDHADKIEGKLLLEKEIGKFTHTTNIIFEKQVGGDSEKETEGGLAWGSRYRWQEYFEPGFEIHSEFGELNESKSFNEQEHLGGPVFYGKIGHFKYNVGYLFGISDDAVDGKLKWIIEYEIKV